MILHFVLLNSIPFLLMKPIRFSSSFYVTSLSFSVLTVPSNFVSSGNFISRLPCAKIIKENVKKKKNLSQNRSQKSFPWACASLYKSSSSGFLTSYQMHTCWNKKPGRYFTEQFNSLYLCQLSHWSHRSKACRIHFIISIPGWKKSTFFSNAAHSARWNK